MIVFNDVNALQRLLAEVRRLKTKKHREPKEIEEKTVYKNHEIMRSGSGTLALILCYIVSLVLCIKSCACVCARAYECLCVCMDSDPRQSLPFVFYVFVLLASYPWLA